MLTLTKPFASLRADDLMSREVVVIPDQMSLQGAARVLSRAEVSGAPVVDGEGRCIGSLSATDFVHWAENGGKAAPLTEACGDTAWKPWQMLDQPEHAATLVGEVMNRDPVAASPQTSIGELARRMLDAHVHRILIVDETDKPVGVVSATDILAALARIEPAFHDESHDTLHDE